MCLFFVMREESVRRPEPNRDISPAALFGRTSLFVLHINDSTDDQVLFQAACKKANVPFEWQVAESAERGIAYLQGLLALTDNQPVRWPDLILLDLLMPPEHGLKVLEYVRATPELRLLPVIILTGHPSSSAIENAYKLGANAFHEKPVSFEGMVDLVKLLYTAWSQARRPSL